MSKCDQCGADMVWQGSMKDGGLKCLNLHYEGTLTLPRETEDYIERLKQIHPDVFKAQVAQQPAGAPLLDNNFRIERVLQAHSVHGNTYLNRLICETCNYTSKWVSHDLTNEIGVVKICPNCGKQGFIHA